MTSTLTLALHFTVVAALVLAFVLGVRLASRRLGEPPAVVVRRTAFALFGAVLWLALTYAVGAGGLLKDFDAMPPPQARLLLPSLALTLAIGCGRVGDWLIRGVPLALLVGFQVFRVGVELMLWRLANDGHLPERMTFTGGNFDVLTGLSAPIVGWLAWKGRLSNAALRAWNIAGCVLLATIVTLAILSMPGPFKAFHDGPENRIVFDAPFIWLPAVEVQAALLGHLLVFRWLSRNKAATASPL